MGRTPKDVTEAELAVLQILWERGPSTIRALCDALYPDGGASEYATVQKLLERLENKGYVDRDRASVPHVFAAAVHRADLIDRRLQDLADQLCDGSRAPLLSRLVHGRRLTRAEIDELRDLVDALDARARRGRRDLG